MFGPVFATMIATAPMIVTVNVTDQVFSLLIIIKGKLFIPPKEMILVLVSTK